MQRRKIGVCIADAIYQNRFQKCLMSHYDAQFEIHIFSRLGELLEDLNQQQRCEAYVLGDVSRAEISGLVSRGEKVIFLKEDVGEENSTAPQNLVYVEKYQEVYRIVEEVEKCLENIERKLALPKGFGKSNTQVEELCDRLRENVLNKMDFSRELLDEEVLQMIEAQLSSHPEGVTLSAKEKALLEQRVFNSLRKLDVLQELLEDDAVTEIMVNGPDNIFYEKAGTIYKHIYHFSSEEKLQDVIQQIVGKHNRVVNLTSPIVDTRLEDGSRVNVVLTPVAIDGSAISIRKFSKIPFDMDAMVQMGTISEEAALFLKKLVQARYNLFVSGGTSSGKTTFLNALSACIP